MTPNYYNFSMSSAFRLTGQSPDAERAGDRKLTRCEGSYPSTPNEAACGSEKGRAARCRPPMARYC